MNWDQSFKHSGLSRTFPTNKPLSPVSRHPYELPFYEFKNNESLLSPQFDDAPSKSQVFVYFNLRLSSSKIFQDLKWGVPCFPYETIEAIKQRIEIKYGIPFVSLHIDGLYALPPRLFFMGNAFHRRILALLQKVLAMHSFRKTQKGRSTGGDKEN